MYALQDPEVSTRRAERLPGEERVRRRHGMICCRKAGASGAAAPCPGGLEPPEPGITGMADLDRGRAPCPGGHASTSREPSPARCWGRRTQAVNGNNEIAHFQGRFQLRACHRVDPGRCFWNMDHMGDQATEPGTQHLPGQDHDQTGKPFPPPATASSLGAVMDSAGKENGMPGRAD